MGIRTEAVALAGLTAYCSETAPSVAAQSNQVSLIAQLLKNTPAKQETQVQFQGQEDPLEKG